MYICSWHSKATKEITNEKISERITQVLLAKNVLHWNLNDSRRPTTILDLNLEYAGKWRRALLTSIRGIIIIVLTDIRIHILLHGNEGSNRILIHSILKYETHWLILNRDALGRTIKKQIGVKTKVHTIACC
jgi:hypothetical protein